MQKERQFENLFINLIIKEKGRESVELTDELLEMELKL